MAKNAGFTLLEVLIAVMILAVMGTALLRATAGSVSSLSAVEEKTMEALVATNFLVDLQQSGVWPSASRLSKKVEMAKRHWQIDADVKPTSNESFQRIEVHVRPASDENEVPPLEVNAPVILVGFVGKY